MDKYPEDRNTVLTMQALNEIFAFVFVLEMLLKMTGLGLKGYARDTFNIFDSFIVVISIIDIVLLKTLEGTADIGALSAFRGLRLMRIFKLARSW